MEASWHLGDPPPSWSVENGPSMSTERAILRKINATVEVGPAGGTRSAGKQRDRLSCWSRETFPTHSEVGEECPHNWIRSQRKQSQTGRCASRRWRICSHRSFLER